MTKNGKLERFSLKTVLCCIVGAAVLTILLASTVLRSLFYTRNGQDLDLIITNHGIQDENSMEEEPGTNLEIKCIQGIDHEMIPETEGWHAGGYGIGCDRTEKETSLVIPVTNCQYITMSLVSCSSAGPITIQVGDTVEELNLYSPEWHRVIWNYHVPSKWSLWESRADVLALFALCLSILLLACYFRSRRLSGAVIFQKLYHIGFFAFFICILVYVIKLRLGDAPGRILTAMLPFLAAHLLLGWVCRKVKEPAPIISVKFLKLTVWDLLFAVGLFIMLQVQIYMGRQLAVEPGWDFGNVFYGALEVAENGHLVNLNNCFLQWRNNLFAVIYLAAMFKVIMLFQPVSIFTGIWINVMMIDLAVVLIFLWMRKVWNPVKAFYGAVICFFLSPFYLYVPIFYTDTLSLPFVAGILWLYEWAGQREADGKKAWIGYGALGVLCLTGSLLKGSLLVFAIAIVLHMLLRQAAQKTNRFTFDKRKMICLGCFLTGFLAAFLIWTVSIPASHVINYDAQEQYEFPVVQSLMMGMGGIGNWQGIDDVLAANTDTIAERTQVCTHMLQNRIREKGLIGVLKHFVNKGARVTWGDGLYFTYEKLKRDPLYESWLHDYVLWDGVHFTDLERWTTGFHIVMLLFVLLSIWKGIRSREVDSVSFVRLIVLGIMLFFFLWETRTRYLTNITPLLAAMTVDGSCDLAGLPEQWRRRRKKQRTRELVDEKTVSYGVGEAAADRP